MSRTYRKSYTKSKAFDSSCRSHGGCPWCEGNRTHSDTKRRVAADAQMKQAPKDEQADYEDAMVELAHMEEDCYGDQFLYDLDEYMIMFDDDNYLIDNTISMT